ncbi:hypothetical protein TSAR_014283, partial [Trichomalopsis sarcophagae]
PRRVQTATTISARARERKNDAPPAKLRATTSRAVKKRAYFLVLIVEGKSRFFLRGIFCMTRPNGSNVQTQVEKTA